MYLTIGNKIYTLLEEVQTILRASTRSVLGAVGDKFITVGFGNSLGRPHVGIAPYLGDFANEAFNMVKIILITSGRNRDYVQELQTERLREDIVAELMDPANRRTTDWMVVNYNKGRQSEDPFNPKLMFDEIDVKYQWGGVYNA